MMAHTVTRTSATWDTPDDLPEVITKLSKLMQYARMTREDFEREMQDKQAYIDRELAEKAEYEAEFNKKFRGR